MKHKKQIKFIFGEEKKWEKRVCIFRLLFVFFSRVFFHEEENLHLLKWSLLPLSIRITDHYKSIGITDKSNGEQGN
jgi:hypothetical protein